ncbi:MAG: DUF3786 domain-containing protein [Proteobacteria bacterium]|nr:DUF3786 domain-containing protein [Pseudomonadota bacterium]
MTDQYRKIALNNLEKLYGALPEDLDLRMGAERNHDEFVFQAFGEACRITRQDIILGQESASGVLGILISLYALHAASAPVEVEPLKSFKEFPNSMPYVGAFSSHTESVLVPHVERIQKNTEIILSIFNGREASASTSGDFSFIVFPLPKIALCYVFYREDDEFPASAICLYSKNANRFLPMDALADVGEYTSKKIIQLAES